MFVCDPCYKKDPSGFSFSPFESSRGACEMCGKTSACHDVRIIPKPKEILSLENATDADQRGWNRDMNAAPWDHLVMVSGSSGYTKYPRYFCAAYRSPDWHGMEFNSVQGNRLSDSYGREGAPDMWRELPELPEVL